MIDAKRLALRECRGKVIRPDAIALMPIQSGSIAAQVTPTGRVVITRRFAR